MDYQSMIQLNPIIPFSPSGYQKARWFNYRVLSTASVKSFQLFVYGNLAQDAVRDANQLKQYFESRDVGTDIAIGILAPKLDDVSLAYVVQMNMNVGALRMGIGMGGTKSQLHIGIQQHIHHEQFDVVNHGLLITNNGKTIVNT